jgi:hypothetical protein
MAQRHNGIMAHWQKNKDDLLLKREYLMLIIRDLNK